MKLTRQYYHVKDVVWGNETKFDAGVLTLNKEELVDVALPVQKNITNIDFEIVKPGENTRIIHVLDTVQPMIKVEGRGEAYSGFFGSPHTVGEGTTNLLTGFAIMESAPLPWDSVSTSSGLLYPREAIVDMVGPIKAFSPFSETINLVMVYELEEGKSSEEYDQSIRLCTLKVSEYIAGATKNLTPDSSEVFSLKEEKEELPNVVLVWQLQNQGPYSNSFLYGKSIDELVPTILHPNELLDGCIVSGNYVWPAFKVPTYLHVNQPILLELFKRHGKDLNFKGVILSRSHNPTHWHKERSANICVKLSRLLNANGLIMAWEGGGNAATDGMLTVQEAERNGIKASLITFEFGGKDGSEGILLVDDVPEADAIVSGGSIEKPVVLPAVERVVGGTNLRLDKETGGSFPPAKDSIEFDTTTLIYCSGNQSGHSKLFGEAY